MTTRTRTEQVPRATSTRPSSRGEASSTLDDQIRGYRQTARLRHNVRRRLRSLSPGGFRNTLEQQLSPDQELALSRSRRANLVPAEVLYTHNNNEVVNRVYQHYEERSAHVVDRQMDLRFIEEESYRRLVDEGLQFIHLGMGMVRIHMLHRNSAGIEAMIVFRDTRWTDDRQVIASMSVDMTHGSQLVYVIPDAMLSIHDFYNHIQVSIQTRGYNGGWTGGDSNMIVTRSLIGRLTNQSMTNFGYQIQGVTDYLTSHGVSCIPGEQWSVTNRSGEWRLQQSSIAPPEQVPTEARLRPGPRGELSMRFTNFRDQAIRERASDEDTDSGRPETSGRDETTHYVGALRFDLKGRSKPREEECFEVAAPDVLQSWMQQLSRSPPRQNRYEGPEWDTLGEPSGKYDYKVRYSAPPPTPWPTKPTGWGDEEEDLPPPRFDSSSESFSGGGEIEPLEYHESSEDSYEEVRRRDTENHNNLIAEGFTQEPRFPGLYAPARIEVIEEDHYEGDASEQSWSEEEPEFDYPQIAAVVNQNNEPELEYPTKKFQELMAKIKGFQNQKVEIAAMNAESSGSGVTSGNFVPPIATTGPSAYPPATGTHGTNIGPQDQGGWGGRMPRSRMPGGYGRPQRPWTLPSAQTENGVMLIIPEDLTLAADAINRWESITINVVSKLAFDNMQDKVDYVENLLGEREKEVWTTWRMKWEDEYRRMVAISDDTRNLTAAIKRVFGVHDPFTGSTFLQNQAYADLERLSCKRMEDVMPFLFTYYQLAAKSGRMWTNEELSDKLFRKLPEAVGPTIEKAYKERYPGLVIGVMARINFIIEYLQNVCKQAALQRSLKNLNFCRTMPVPGYYEKKKYGVRKSTTYKGKPHDTHVKVIKNKDKNAPGRKCKCYLCGIEGHYARECPKKTVQPQRMAYFEGLALADNWDVLSVDVGESDSEGVCSISEGETAGRMDELAAFKTQLPYPVEFEHGMFVLTIEQVTAPAVASGWRRRTELRGDQKVCPHQWSDVAEVSLEDRFCSLCGDNTPVGRRVHCTTCKANLCPVCAWLEFGIKIVAAKTDATKWNYLNKDELIAQLYEHNAFLTHQNKALQARIEELTKGRNNDLIDLCEGDPDLMAEICDELFRKPASGETSILRGKERVKLEILEEEVRGYREEQELRTPLQKLSEGASTSYKAPEESDEERVGALLAEGELEKLAAVAGESYSRMPKGGLNKLYHLNVQFVIPKAEGGHISFTVAAIIDTGCTCCCINGAKVPKEAQEEASYAMTFAGVNSRGTTRKKMRAGKMVISGNDFYTPYISVFDMDLPDIDMLIGCNFIKAMQGGIRFEGTEVTIYKKVTTIQTTLEPIKLGYAEFDPDIQVELERAYYAAPVSEAELIKLRDHRLLAELKEQGFIGNDPMLHWAKNQVKCKLDIINPDITIQGKPPSTATPEIKDRYQRHIDALLSIGVIRPSKSRHRTAAFITYSGTSVDPKTGEEIRGKERMVFDYRALNNNTHKDQYTLPGINSIVAAVGNAKIYSKFDLKAGFHQVLMEESSIPWTAFITPVGFYEWLVMPFGIANAPAVFQRKMDNCFHKLREFVAVYIDDILVFSNSLQEHESHLRQMLEVCRKNGLVLSPTKMKVAVTTVEFLGAIIGNGKIKLQPHIVKKISEVDDESLRTLKGLRSWLGIINYARNYIPNCGTLLGPLYSKTSENGDRRMSPQDWKLVRKVKELVKSLPDLELPPAGAYVVIETDGCMEGWGGVCKWKHRKGESASAEKVCAYASGKFPAIKSTIDAEMHGVMNSLEKFQIYFMDKGEVTIRTDCQAIVAFYEKLNANKPSRVRWLNFCDYITNTGVKVVFEHIKGKDNVLADTLSRLTQTLAAVREMPAEQEEILRQALNNTEVQPKERRILMDHICGMLEAQAQKASLHQHGLSP
uniref:RNA-directed DNA polymerase n=1 Tax=Gooseberry vein banding associated virus TaxID=157270 RepID=F5BDD2_9VIRU|nr:polyprotein [Gooseberry vein banding associated virus]